MARKNDINLITNSEIKIIKTIDDVLGKERISSKVS